MQKENVKPPSGKKLLFYNFETDQSDLIHKVNFAVSQNFQGDTTVFEGYNALDEFCTFLFDEKHRDYTVLSHNGKAFDSIFVLNWLLKYRATADISIIRNGQKNYAFTCT